MPVNLGSSYAVVTSPPVSTYVTPPEVSGYLFRAGWSQSSQPYWAHFHSGIANASEQYTWTEALAIQTFADRLSYQNLKTMTDQQLGELIDAVHMERTTRELAR